MTMQPIKWAQKYSYNYLYTVNFAVNIFLEYINFPYSNKLPLQEK